MRDFTKTKRIVIKIGTNVLTKNGGVDTKYVQNIARQINALLKTKKQIVIVTSGAIGMGAGQLKIENKTKDTKTKQACAAIGQPLLMAEYKKAFAKYKITAAQVLLTAEVLNNRKTYLNLKGVIETLLKLGVVPIINENDCVSTDEIGTAVKTGFGDNDKLSALVASKIDADALIMLTDIDGLYDKDPKKNKNAKKIPAVYEITKEIVKNAGGSGSRHATGGMKTKIEAAKIAANAGCRMILADGRKKDVIIKIMAGEIIGTIFMPKRKLGNRSRWILNSHPAGTVKLDAGAIKAIENKKSLLPSGIAAVEGTFEKGAVVMLGDKAKAVVNFGSAELKKLAGKHSREIEKLLGKGRKDVVATPEDIVIIN